MRKAGILMPISSLASNYGIGTLGKEAYHFIDFLKKAGQSYWQILPICQTGFGDSPYQSVSSYSGNPYWIDFDVLIEEGYLEKDEVDHITWCHEEDKVDYGTLYNNRYGVLKKAVARLVAEANADFAKFMAESKDWLDDYSLYMTIKDSQSGRPWSQWPEELKRRSPEALSRIESEYSEDISFWKGVQYFFFKQWKKLCEYAHASGISIIGDVPIYVAGDSCDVWTNPGGFYLDDNLDPIEVAGCPPDGFSADGQLWGNPLYNWDKMKDNGYKWWTRRIHRQMEIYDVIRLDHFRGFDSYYSIPYGDETAKNGHWNPGPGLDFFHALESSLGKLHIIAEDLGFLTDSSRQLVKDSGYPGMKVFELGFDTRDSESGYMPHKFDEHCIVYTGTHDNDTILGWMSEAPENDVKKAIDYCRLSEAEGYNWGMMKVAWSSVASLAIMQAQDLLGLGSEARINTPSTVGENWRWRSGKDVFTETLAEKISYFMDLYGRK